MAAAVQDYIGNFLRLKGGSGADAGDVVVQTNDVSRYDTFMLASTAGAMQVFASLDGVNYLASAVAVEDMSAADTTGQTYVNTTAAGKLYRLRGAFSKLQVQQSGATAVAGATLVCSRYATQGF